MGWFSKRRPDQVATAEELASLAAHGGGDQRVLTSGRGRGVLVVALEWDLAVLRDGEWALIGWHEIQHGAWRQESDELVWTLVDGSEDAAELDEPAEIPTVFLERVNASIVLQQRLRVPDTSFTVVVAARRALRPDAPLVWTVQPLGSTRLDDPRVEAFVVDATARMAEERAAPE